MKFGLIILFFASTAFANPFETFIGTYIPNGKPSLVLQRYNDCKLINYKKITDVKISEKKKEVYFLELAYILNRNPQIARLEFSEGFAAAPCFFTNHNITGDLVSAKFERIDRSCYTVDAYTYLISKFPDDTFELKITFEYVDEKGQKGLCAYSVGLLKRP